MVTNNEDNNVSVIDAKNYKLITNVAVGKGPHGFRISSDSKYTYVVNMGEDTVSVVDKEPNGISFIVLKVNTIVITAGINERQIKLSFLL